MATPIHTTDSDFERDVLDSGVPVLVDFWAEWCGPCRAMNPALEALAGEFEGKAKMAKLNVDENREVPGRYGVRGVPTFLLFKGGQVVQQVIGAVSKTRLAEDIQRVLD